MVSVPRDGLDGRAGGHPAQQRQLDRLDPDLGGGQLERAAAVPGPLDEPLVLQVGQVLVDRGQRGEAEVLADLLDGGRVALALDVAGQEIEDLFLSLGEVHALLRFRTSGNERRRRSGESQCSTGSGAVRSAVGMRAASPWGRRAEAGGRVRWRSRRAGGTGVARAGPGGTRSRAAGGRRVDPTSPTPSPRPGCRHRSRRRLRLGFGPAGLGLGLRAPGPRPRAPAGRPPGGRRRPAPRRPSSAGAPRARRA